MTTDVRTAKNELRWAALRRRAGIEARERETAGHALADSAADLLDMAVSSRRKGIATIAAYISMGSEIPLDPLLRLALGRGLRILVPRLGSGLDLGWGVLRSMEDLHTVGRFRSGRERPREPGGPVLPAEAIGEAGVVLVPALSVDLHGTRLGRGGGWYDRMLASAEPCPAVVAVCWTWEVVAGPLPHEPHDVPVNTVLTPDGMTSLG